MVNFIYYINARAKRRGARKPLNKRGLSFAYAESGATASKEE